MNYTHTITSFDTAYCGSKHLPSNKSPPRYVLIFVDLFSLMG